MKIIISETMRFGTNRFEEGEEVDLPDRFALALIAHGKASDAGDKPAKKAKKAEEPDEEEKPKKDYKTRQIKAEDTD
jgi:hypothetical protein